MLHYRLYTSTAQEYFFKLGIFRIILEYSRIFVHAITFLPVSGAPEHFDFWRGKTSKGAHLSARSLAREQSDRAGGGCGRPKTQGFYILVFANVNEPGGGFFDSGSV